MVLSKIVLVFCGVALALAATVDLAWVLLINIIGGIGIFGASTQALNRIPMFVLSVLWILSILLGWIVARKLHLIPQF